jgi:hypothetical protein
MHKRVALKILKFTLKQLRHVSAQSPSSGSVLFELAKVTAVKIMLKYVDVVNSVVWLHMRPQHQINHTNVFQLIILTTVTLASSNNRLPDDRDYTETCRSCFNVNFNVF